MNHYFLDSSALIKRYVSEVGSTWVKALIELKNINLILIADITQVEVISGIMRRNREGTITNPLTQTTRTLFQYHVANDYQLIGLSQLVIQRAQNLLTQYQLRAYDAVQLASALESNSSLLLKGLNPLTFLSADNRLLTSAQAEGLITDNPNNYP